MILIDTHVWLWWVADPDRLSRRARAAIDDASRVGVCTISCWEIAMLVTRGRVRLDREVNVWVRQALAHDRAQTAPLTPDIAVEAALLDANGFPGDPADRIIYATARALNAPLVTRDQALLEFDPRRTIW